MTQLEKPAFKCTAPDYNTTIIGALEMSEKKWVLAVQLPGVKRQLIDSGIRLVKLFMHITPDEQLRRFRDRLIDPVKRWKLSYEDFRNRARWPDYETAIEEMMAETATDLAPWYLIPANNNPYGRIAAFSSSRTARMWRWIHARLIPNGSRKRSEHSASPPQILSAPLIRPSGRSS